MKKLTYILLSTVVICTLTACAKDKPATNNRPTLPASTNSTATQQTTSSIRVSIDNITSPKGAEIDFIGAIRSAENMELSRSMIYVDSSSVDSNTPGTYEAYYTFDYLGTTIISSNKITIVDNTEETESNTDMISTDTPIEEQAFPDALITLTNGTVASIKCTSARYIVETFTEESYFEEKGFTFLNSKLKVLFNTGETQVIETVVTRVQPQEPAATPQ